MAAKKPWADLLEGTGKPGSKRASGDEPVSSDAPPTTVYMHTLVGNPENPRTEADYSDSDSDFRELKESMKSVGQLQPAVALSREAFLRVKPEYGSSLGDAQWVVVLGNRRFHAARQLGWTKFEIRVRDRLGNEDDDKLDEAVVVENIHRKNIPPYKEAEFLQRMVERHGSQERVAERIGKSQMYVSNRLSLLNLAPELREVVDTKQLKVKAAEKIARIQDPEQQRAVAAEELRKAHEPKPPRRRADVAVATPVQNPVLDSASPTVGDGGGAVPVSPPREVEFSHLVPEPRVTAPAPVTVDTDVQWSDGAAVMDAAFVRLDPGQRSAFILRYFKRSTGVEAVVSDMRGQLAAAERTSLASILDQVAAGLRREGL
ncbi:ParB/RepB/Spo0J family partition protein [Streptomyces sp. NPDC090303]|uniref:ParB/RepB/Spo0J family partition protein n=1 Tax=Streptomyces sp. NPDC090303 TaxID=3365960 RepID=UPI0037FB1801